MSVTVQQVEALLAKNRRQRDDRKYPPMPSQRKVKIIATFTVNEADLSDLQVYDIFRERLPDVLNRNLIDVRVELI